MFCLMSLKYQMLPETTSMCLLSQSYPALCDPMDCRPPASSVHGDSSSKNTGVDCHALLQGIFPTQGSKPSLPHCRWILYHLNHQGSPLLKIPSVCSVAKSCPTLCVPVDYSPPCSFTRGNSPGKNTGVDCHALLQGIFLTQEWNWGILNCRQILYQLSYQGSLKEERGNKLGDWDWHIHTTVSKIGN